MMVVELWKQHDKNDFHGYSKNTCRYQVDEKLLK